MGGDSSRRPDARAVDSVLRAIELVEERMGEDIGAEDMARAACYSSFYFSRLFAQATGHAPYDYLMRRRVAAAAEELVCSSRSLIDIAQDRGFDVPDTFARAFRRCFGMVPSEARKAGSYPRAIARTMISRAYVEEMLGNPPAAPIAILSEEIELEGYWFDGSPGEIEANLFFSIPSIAVVERDESLRAKRAFIGCISAAKSDADARKAPAYPFAASRIPGGARARFRLDGGVERMGFIVEYAYRSWLPLSGRRRAAECEIIEAEDGGALDLIVPIE